MSTGLAGLPSRFIYMLPLYTYRHKTVDELPMDCPVCSHPKVEEIDDGLTMGVDFAKLAKRFGLKSQSLIDHWKHGMEEELTAPERKIVSSSNDIYSVLRFKLGHLKKRFNDLLLSDPATGQSRELIQLSKAIDDTITVTLKVKKEMGITEETRIAELEKMMSEIVMIMPRMCKADQELLESALQLQTIEV